MGFSLGSFAGGVSQGLEQGQQMRARQMAMQDELRQRSAQEAASNWLQSLAAQPDGAAPTAVPPQPTPAVPPGPQGGAPPMPGGMPQQVPMPGAQPMPQAGPQPMPQAGPPPGGGPMPGPPGAPPMPAPQQPRPTPPPGPMGQAPQQGPQVSGTAGGGSGDVFADAKKTLQSVARGIAQANPGRKWKAGELLDAVNLSIKTMDGLNPMEKIAAQAQIAGSKAQSEYWLRETQALDEQRKERADAERVEKDKQASVDRNTRITSDLQRAKMTSDSRERVARIQSATRLQAAEISQAGQNDRSDKLLDFRQQALDAGLDEKEWAASMQAELKAQGLSDAFINKTFSAQAASGQTPAAPTRPKVGGSTPAPPIRNKAKGKVEPGQTYKSADDVVKAYKAGKLSHDQASTVLKQNGWAE